jgi:cystathionine beta-lyase/cystathionine gamma-synthase
MTAPDRVGPATLAVHGGQRVRDDTAFPVPALVANSAVLLDSVEQGWEQLTNETAENYAYQRYSNPTVVVLEEKFRALEGSAHALAFSSGMTACYALFRVLTTAGDHIVAQHALYHEISDQLGYDRTGCGVDVTFVTDYSVDSFAAAFRPTTRLVFVESPTNPAMLDVDLAALAQLCTERGVLLAVDNTMLTHVHQQPLDFGAAVAVYSTTKTINGHGDAMGGLLTTNDRETAQRLRSFRDNTGQIMQPFAAWLTVRGLRTLPLRLERHGRNAERVAAYLRGREPTYPVMTAPDTGHAAVNKVTGNAGIVTVTFPSRRQGTEFIRAVRLLKIGTTFGNLESIVYHFGTFARPSRDLAKIGLDTGLVRISVGIEDPEDIIADIEQAMARSEKAVADG